MAAIKHRYWKLRSKLAKKITFPGWATDLLYRGRPDDECPICGFVGPFRDIHSQTGPRASDRCPDCGSQGRERLQWLGWHEIFERYDTSGMSILHCAPEQLFRNLLSSKFGRYETADIAREDVDHDIDLRDIALAADTFDVVFASDVTEHIVEERDALREIRRILKPGGFAVLPSPVVAPETVEYGTENYHDSGHVRANGPDYFDRLRNVFDRVEVRGSSDFPERYQLYSRMDWSFYPTAEVPHRPGMPGRKHSRYFPICYVEN